MKTLIATLFAVLLISGCASMKCEPYGDTIWKSGHHAYFSAWGYKNPTYHDWEMSQIEDWNGRLVEYKGDK